MVARSAQHFRIAPEEESDRTAVRAPGAGVQNSAVFCARSASADGGTCYFSPCLIFWYFWIKPKAQKKKCTIEEIDSYFGKYPAPSIRRFPARSRVTTFLLHNTVYEFAARTYYPRRISKSGSDMPLILHYGIALSVIITDYIPMSRLQSGYNSLPKINGKNKI